MTPEQWKRIEEVFDRAIELPVAERAGYLERSCGDDSALRASVEALLASAPEAASALRGAIEAAAASLQDTMRSALVGRRLGAYRLEERLGEGGMGAVYRATRDDAEYRSDVAIKILHHGLGAPEAIARFRDERQILAALDHPHIIKLLDGGRTDDGLPYLVMEYIEGTPITQFARDGGLSIRARVELVHQICGAVQYAHDRLVVHRDLKPSNILVTASGTPKLLDFGIAKVLDASAEREARTRTGGAMFTPEYASPEQVRGESVSVATDIYSLGAVLYELLAGRPPLLATGTLEIARVITEVDPEPPSAVTAEHRRELAGDLDNIVLRALHKEPSRRYESARQLAEDLQRYLDGRPVLARKATAGYRLRKFVRRNRTRLAVASAAAAAISIAASIATLVVARSASDPVELCARGDTRVAGVWPARKDAVRATLLAPATPGARDAWGAVEPTLDTYAHAWTTMHHEACVATHRRHEQSEAALDLRMRCLDHRLDQLAALVALLEQPAPDLAETAARAANTLPRLSTCADVAALAAPTPPPANAGARSEVERLRKQLAEADALGLAGRYGEETERLDQLLPAARATGYAPLVAEIEVALGNALDRNGEFKRAADVMRDASYAADEGGDRKLALRARIELIWTIGHEQSAPERGQELAREAEAQLKGLGGDRELEALLASNLATVLDDQGRHTESAELDRRVLALREADLGPDDLMTGMARVNLAVDMARMKRLDEALALDKRGLATYEKRVGKHHPLYAHTLFNIADSERDLGRFSEAKQHATAALELITMTLGPEHNLVASAENVLGLIAEDEGAWSDAAVHLRRALAVCEKRRGPDHLFVGQYAVSLAIARRHLGDAAEARALTQRALAIFTKLDDRYDAAHARAELGSALAALGDRKGALAALEAAVAALAADPENDPGALSDARFALARVLAEDPAALARARELVRQAATGRPQVATEAEAWLAAHPARER